METQVVWMTWHTNFKDTQDLEELEAEVIAPSFAAYIEYEKDTTMNFRPKHLIPTTMVQS
jgi:hypothetical protein